MLPYAIKITNNIAPYLLNQLTAIYHLSANV
jgi:hypothetical protein